MTLVIVQVMPKCLARHVTNSPMPMMPLVTPAIARSPVAANEPTWASMLSERSNASGMSRGISVWRWKRTTGTLCPEVGGANRPDAPDRTLVSPGSGLRTCPGGQCCSMRAVVWHGRRDVRVDTVPDPTIEAPTDAIVRITSSGLCGSDLHLYEVMGPFMEEGDILGHEPMGIVEAVGAEVTHIAPGDRVVVPFNISCGHCWMCDRELFAQCE